MTMTSGDNTSASNNNEHRMTMTRSGETTSASNNDEHRTTMTRDRNTSTSNNVQRKPVSETGAREGRLQTRNRHRGRVAFWAYNLSDLVVCKLASEVNTQFYSEAALYI